MPATDDQVTTLVCPPHSETPEWAGVVLGIEDGRIPW